MADDAKRSEIETTPLGDVLGRVLRRVLRRGKHEVGRAADSGRRRLEVRQLRADRDAFWGRLGKTAYRLVESGELDHPALRKAMVRIDEIEARLQAVEAGAPVDATGGSPSEVDEGDGDR